MTDQERKSVNEILAINTGLIEQNAKLLEAAKRAYSYLQAEKEGGGYYDPTAYLMLEDAITEAGE